MRILIAPYSAKLPGGGNNPKNYNHWTELISLLKEHQITQIGVSGEEQLVPDFRVNLSARELRVLLETYDTFISVDSFLPHMAHYYEKYGIVLFGQSDPELFGYKENINLLKSREYLRANPFSSWNEATFNPDAFITPELIVNNLTLFAK